MGVIIFFTLLTSCPFSYGQNHPGLSNGKLDLTNFDFNTIPKLPLNGTWEFYNDQLLTPKTIPQGVLTNYLEVPSVWNDISIEGDKLSGTGYATYRLKIQLPANIPALSIEMPNVYSSYILYINGQIVAQNGQTGVDKSTAIPQWRYETQPLKFSGGEELDLILQVSNFHHNKGGIHKSIYLGRQNTLNHKRELAVIANGMLVGGVFILGAFFLLFYVIRKRDLAVLYFGLLAVIWSVRSMFSNIYISNALFKDISWNVAIKVEYISLYLSLLFGILFISKVFSEGFRKIFVNILSVVNFLFIFITLVLAPYYFTALLPFYQLFILINCLLVLTILIRAAIKKRSDVWYSIAGILMGLAMVIFELSSYHYNLRLSVVFINLGYLTAFFLNSLVLAHRFVDAFKQMHKLREEQIGHLSRL